MTTLRILGSYTKLFFLKWMAGRSFILTTVVNQAVPSLVGWAVWSVLFPQPAVSTYYVALIVVQLATSSYENYILSEKIYLGTIAEELLCPHGTLIPSIAENLAMRAWNLLTGVPVLVLAVILLQVPIAISPAALGWAALSLLLASALQLTAKLLVGTLAFWTPRVEGLIGVVDALTFLVGGIMIPRMFMPDGLSSLAGVLPFWSMGGATAELISGQGTPWKILGIQVLWLAILIPGLMILWRRGTRRLELVGG